METAKAPTTPSMLMLPLPLLLLLWVLLCGATLGSPLPDHELKMLEMMRNILGVDSSRTTDSRSPRSMAFASSIPYEDSLPEEASDSMRLFEEELDDSDECGDYSCLRSEPTPTPSQMDLEIVPCPLPLIPMDHPCFVRVIVLQTPLLRHDPCKNFTVTTKTTTKSPKLRKCKPKVKATTAHNTTTSTTRTTAAMTSNETSEATDPQTREDTTTTRSTSTPASTTTEEPSTTTEISTTTPTPTPTPTTATTTTHRTNTTIAYSRHHQLKSLRGQRSKKKRPNVPDAPKIKLDGAMQSSDTFEVFQTTEAGELRLQPETTEPECEAETTTTPAPVDCVEDASEVEVTREDGKSKAKPSEKTAEGDSTADYEDYDDAQDQNTNLCPQFSNPEGPDDPVAANMRRAPSSRYRKTGKNYVEPILYEGQIGKPRHSNGLVPQRRRDYYVSNKQIMPKPRPRYRAPLPHSIYMNNIVRGVKCTDEVGNPVHPLQALHPLHPLQPRRYRSGQLTPRGVWLNRRHGAAPGEYVPMGPNRHAHGNPRSRSNPLYGLSSGEDIDSYGGDSGSYYDDGSGEPLSWSREKVGHGGSSGNTDPCATEHRQERSRERERERDGDRESEQLMENVEPRFFT